MNIIIKHSNGLYEDKGLHYHYFYKMIGNSVHRYSKILESWILCLDDTVSKQIKQLEENYV